MKTIEYGWSRHLTGIRQQIQEHRTFCIFFLADCCMSCQKNFPKHLGSSASSGMHCLDFFRVSWVMLITCRDCKKLASSEMFVIQKSWYNLIHAPWPTNWWITLNWVPAIMLPFLRSLVIWRWPKPGSSHSAGHWSAMAGDSMVSHVRKVVTWKHE